MNEAESLLRDLRSRFKAAADGGKAASMKAYMKGNFEFFGLQKPVRAELSKDFLKAMRGLSPDTLSLAVRWLWKQPQREFQYTAMEMMWNNRKNWTQEMLPLMEELVTEKSWWDTVDFIAASLIGHYFTRWPEKKNKIAEGWSMHENMWLNRTALLFQLKYRDKTDFQLLCGFINRHRASGEFFLQKAIGWCLRQYAYTDPARVAEFVRNVELKPLSRREAMKHLEA